MSSSLIFNPGPEIVGSRGADSATVHYSWKLAGMFRGTNREGYALQQAMGTLEVDQLHQPPADAEIFIGSTAQMIKLQRRLGIAAGKIAHDSGSIDGETSVRYIGERLYDVATDPYALIDQVTGEPLSFPRAVGKLALPFAHMVEDDMVYHYFNVRPEQVGLGRLRAPLIQVV